VKARFALAALAAATTTMGLTTVARAAAGDTLEEVIVTAEHREVSLLDTPISITSLSGDQLRDSGVNSTAQLADSVPNVTIHTTGDFFITIRGVTSNDATEKGDPSAAFMMDGAYIARPQAQDVAFFDIARVEVLRGPQGTLWGRNTTAGLLHVISNKPVHKFESALNATVGSFSSTQLDGMVNLPVSEKVALRGAFAYDRRNSFIEQKDPPGFRSRFSGSPARNNVSVRLQAGFDFSDSFNAVVRTDYSTMKGAQGVASQISSQDVIYTLPAQLPAAPATGNITLNLVPRQATYLYPHADVLRTRTYALTENPGVNNKTWGVGAELNWKLGGTALTYVGSYRRLDRDEGFPLAVGAPFTLNAFFIGNYWQNSQELRIATANDGPFEGQAGIYYFKEQSGIALWLPNLIPGVPFFGFPQDPTISESKAVFGQGSYKFTPSLKLIAGVRYSKDDKSRVGATALQQSLSYNPATDLRFSNSAQRSDSKTTWRLGMDYNRTDDMLLYASVATGYKAGGFGDGCQAGTTDANGIACNQIAAVRDLYYKPENLTAYEVGVKTKINNVMSVTAAVFNYDYKDMQLSSIGVVGPGPSLVTHNAGRSRVTGLELESVYAPSETNRWSGSFTWLDAKYVEFLTDAGSAVSATGGTLTVNTNFANFSLDRSPSMTASLGYTHTRPLAAGGKLATSVRTKFSASYTLTDFSNTTQYTQPAYTKSDLSLTYSAPEDRWYARAFVQNLENTLTVNSAGVFQGYASVYTSQPRTYGVAAGVKF
jgi:iron complex outermembrane receptor protein